MAARVLNPVMLTEFCKLRSPVRTPMPNRASLAKIKRDLFGPVDKDDSIRFVESELTKHNKIASDRWGFNFVQGFPLAEHKQYMWERVPPTCAVPQMYTLSRAAHVRSSRSCSNNASSMLIHPSYDDLLDERAERSNRTHDDSQLSDDSDTSISSSSSPTTSTTTTNASISVVITASSVQQQQPSASQQRPPLRSSPREKRQPRITDYLKERKRLAPTPKKVSPSKRTRMNNSASRVS